MFSEYLETDKPSDDILEGGTNKEDNNKLQKSNFDNDEKKSKEENKNELLEQREKEKQAKESKSKINEWYNVLSNGYPNGFKKELSNIEKDGKEISNILNIDFSENENGERYLSFSISEKEKEEGKESMITSNITWEFSNFQENKNNTQNSNNSQGNSQNIFPQINISKFGNNQDLGRMLSQLLGGDKNGKQDNTQATEHLLNGTELGQQNNIQKLIGLIDKNIMRSPINDVYGYHDHLNRTLENISKNKKEEDPENKKENYDYIHDYILNTVNRDSLSVYKKNVFDVMLCLCIILRTSTPQEMADLKNTDTENENEKSLLTSISTLTNENMVEYLSSNLDFLLDNNLKSWTLQKYGNDMEMEDFNFLAP